MAFRKILCVVAGAPTDAAALDTAFTLARPAGGHVEALFLRSDPREAVPMVGEGVSGSLMQDIMTAMDRENQRRRTTALATFQQALQAAGATVAERAPGPGGPTGAFTDSRGAPDEAALHAARLADVVVFPTVCAEQDTGTLLALESALMGSGRPLVLAPKAPRKIVGSRIAIAWNGSAQATRAVALALPLLTEAEHVDVFSADTGKTSGDGGQTLCDYLAWHGVTAVPHSVRPDHEAVGAALLRAVGDAGADMLVMGGYGHSRLREMILGGVTRHVLNHAGLPVLMAH